MKQQSSICSQRFTKSCEAFLKRLSKNNPYKFKAIANIVQDKLNKQDNENMTYYLKIVAQIRDDAVIIDDFNKLLNKNMTIKSDKDQWKDIFSLLHNQSPEKLEQLTAVLKEIKSTFTSKEENLEALEKLAGQVKKVLDDEKTRNEVLNKLNTLKENLIQAQEMDQLMSQDEDDFDTMMEEEISEEEVKKPQNKKAIKETITINVKGGPKIGKNQIKIAPPIVDQLPKQPPVEKQKEIKPISTQQLPPPQPSGPTKSEIQFLENVLKNLHPFHEQEFIKLIYLYYESIISISELISLAEVVFNEDKDFEQFKDIMSSRQLSRKKMTFFFRPLLESDVQFVTRHSFSYSELPIKYYFRSSSGKSELDHEILNVEVVSISQGSENSSFHLMRKNQYEIELFKIEDERYEIDIITNKYNIIKKYLNAIKNSDNFEQKSIYMHKILSFKVLQNLYGSELEDFIVEFEKNNYPDKILDIFLERITEKLTDFQEVRDKLRYTT